MFIPIYLKHEVHLKYVYCKMFFEILEVRTKPSLQARQMLCGVKTYHNEMNVTDVSGRIPRLYISSI